MMEPMAEYARTSRIVLHFPIHINYSKVIFHHPCWILTILKIEVSYLPQLPNPRVTICCAYEIPLVIDQVQMSNHQPRVKVNSIRRNSNAIYATSVRVSKCTND